MTASSTRLSEIFGRPRALFPVVHCCDATQAREAAELARSCGADGVFFINQGGLLARAVAELAHDFAVEHPDFWVGVNLLGFDPHFVLGAVLAKPGVRMIWCNEALREPWLGAAQGWDGLLFSGCAFKGQTLIPPDMWGSAALTAGRLGADVVTTSGPRTGVATDPAKPQAMRAAIGDHPLALASGITPNNVGAFLPSTDAYLVATGIEESFGRFDEAQLRRLVGAIHGYQPG